jgi:hypothetical protein
VLTCAQSVASIVVGNDIDIQEDGQFQNVVVQSIEIFTVAMRKDERLCCTRPVDVCRGDVVVSLGGQVSDFGWKPIPMAARRLEQETVDKLFHGHVGLVWFGVISRQSVGCFIDLLVALLP